MISASSLLSSVGVRGRGVADRASSMSIGAGVTTDGALDEALEGDFDDALEGDLEGALEGDLLTSDLALERDATEGSLADFFEEGGGLPAEPETWL